MKTNFTFFAILLALTSFAKPVLDDSTKTYSMPLLSKNTKGNTILSWTEKDSKGSTAFCMATSKDGGKTFGDTKTIFAGMGVGNSRLMRAKLLFKKDGSMVAIFSNRGESKDKKRILDIVFCQSSDDGNTWTAPKSVDSDPTPCVKGFFDAVLLANDEIAVSYLKDVANSTKHEERDLRLVLTKNGQFQPERVIDPVVCDCCNISLLVDAKGALNVYYRDNNDDIRDLAKMTSTDNGGTFSKPQIVYTDNWKIAGCPHSGATSSVGSSSNLVAWYSAAESEKGIRLTTQEGKKLLVINEPSAKNAYLTNNVLLWEQNKGEVGPSQGSPTQIAYRKITNDKVSEIVWVNESVNGGNAVGLVVDNQLVVAYEVRQNNKKNSIKISTVNL
jgi:hypothetical protein